MPCNYQDYPKNWKAIRAEIMKRAGNRCECAGECGVLHAEQFGPAFNTERCAEEHGAGAMFFNGLVVLTIAHLNHRTKDSRRKNLKAMCQRCHNRYDRPHRDETRRLKREALLGPMLPIRPAISTPTDTKGKA